MSGSYEEDFESPTDNHELSFSFHDINMLRKSLEKDSVVLSELNDSPVKNEYCSSGSSCNEELDSSDDCSPPVTSLEEPDIVIEFESKPHSTVSLMTRPTKQIFSEAQSEQCKDNVCLEVSSLLLTQEKEIADFQSKEPNKTATATRSLSAVKRKQNKILPESTQDVIDAVIIENKQLDSNIQSKLPTTNNNPVVAGDLQSGYAYSPVPNIVNNDNTTVHVKQELPLKDSFPQTDLSSSRDAPKENFFKPVLVNLYKQKPASHSPSQLNQSNAIDDKSNDALTEHTLSVITAKVKKMDARSVIN